MPAQTPASNNKFAVLTDNVDLDEDSQGVSASIHAPPSFADVVSGAATTAPLEHALPAAQPKQDEQVGHIPQAWKPLPRNLRFKKLQNAPIVGTSEGPSVGNKRPYELASDLAPKDMPSKRSTPSAAGQPAIATASPILTSATQAQAPALAGAATLVPVSALPPSPLPTGAPQVNAAPIAAQVQPPLDLEETLVHGMLVDTAPNAHNHVKQAYVPPPTMREFFPHHMVASLVFGALRKGSSPLFISKPLNVGRRGVEPADVQKRISAAAAGQSNPDYTAFVNPFIGTGALATFSC